MDRAGDGAELRGSVSGIKKMLLNISVANAFEPQTWLLPQTAETHSKGPVIVPGIWRSRRVRDRDSSAPEG